jgi:hypothetical protein
MKNNKRLFSCKQITLASESREIKKPSESCSFEYDKKLYKIWDSSGETKITINHLSNKF